jgi:hypothetical protein
MLMLMLMVTLRRHGERGVPRLPQAGAGVAITASPYLTTRMMMTTMMLM